MTVLSRATATSAKPGDQSATVVGGEVAGLKVLGTDVLSNVLGTTKVDLAGVTAAQLSAVNALVGQLTATLSSVLSTVPGFPTLSVPAPKVELLTKSVRTGSAGGFGTAGTDLRALAITVPGLSVPTALAVPGAASLPALGGVTQVAGLLTSAPVSLELANLGNAVRFSPATLAAGAGTPTAGTPTAGTPVTATPGAATPEQLPRTGANEALAILGVALLAAAVAVRRRRELEL
ncbi:MAG: LPXTG cell wall anchor domain-containing protein [Frankiales bacterium]|nr:LPXTG cell wall anchor domain-containing protein [Frankiales bacterium]